MTRLEALERVAEAARATLKAYSFEKVCAAEDALSAALRALDTLPPELSGDVVEVELWAHADGDVAVLVRGTAISQDWATNRYRTRLGTTRLTVTKGGGA